MMQISRGHVTLCTIHGLSVRTDLQKPEELQNNFPQLGKFIAALDLTDVDGVVFVGGGLGTHATWWRADGSTATPVIVSGPNI